MKTSPTLLHRQDYLYKPSFHGHLSLIAPDWGAKIVHKWNCKKCAKDIIANCKKWANARRPSVLYDLSLMSNNYVIIQSLMSWTLIIYIFSCVISVKPVSSRVWQRSSFLRSSFLNNLHELFCSTDSYECQTLYSCCPLQTVQAVNP